VGQRAKPRSKRLSNFKAESNHGAPLIRSPTTPRRRYRCADPPTRRPANPPIRLPPRRRRSQLAERHAFAQMATQQVAPIASRCSAPLCISHAAPRCGVPGTFTCVAPAEQGPCALLTNMVHPTETMHDENLDSPWLRFDRVSGDARSDTIGVLPWLCSFGRSRGCSRKSRGPGTGGEGVAGRVCVEFLSFFEIFSFFGVGSALSVAVSLVCRLVGLCLSRRGRVGSGHVGSGHYSLAKGEKGVGARGSKGGGWGGVSLARQQVTVYRHVKALASQMRGKRGGVSS
jgi:hypothetical protein